jgi:hypothetical protein
MSHPFSSKNLNIPLSPSAEQKTEIKAAVANHFSDVFYQSTGLRCMIGPEMIMQLQEDAIPYYVNGARPILFADRPEVKQLLNDYLEQGLIAPVEEATDWAALLVVLRRSKEKLRIVVDPTRLNRFVRRSTHPLERLGMRSQKSTAKQIFSRVLTLQMVITRSRCSRPAKF